MANVELTGNFLATARCLIFADSASGVWSFNPNTNTLTITAAGGSTNAANPTAKVGATTVNGSASTWMRSDAAPPIDLTVAYAWTGKHTWNSTIGLNGVAAPTQPTGYGTPTGNALTSSFAAGSISLANLAAEVAQLVLDLKKYGIIGA